MANRFPWFMTSIQNITYTGKRSPAEIKAKWGFDKDGKIIALEYDWWLDHGPYSEFGDLVTVRQAQFMGAGYDVPNIRAKGYTVAPTTVGARRSVGTALRRPSSMAKLPWIWRRKRWASIHSNCA